MLLMYLILKRFPDKAIISLCDLFDFTKESLSRGQVEIQAEEGRGIT